MCYSRARYNIYLPILLGCFLGLHRGSDFIMLQWGSLKNNQHKWTAAIIFSYLIVCYLHFLEISLFIQPYQGLFLDKSLDSSLSAGLTLLAAQTELCRHNLQLKSREMTPICTSQCQVDSQLAFELPGGEQLVLSRDFVEWFRGFTDAEGNFSLIKGKTNIFSFNFIIGLHIDDASALEYITNTLGLGKVIVNQVSKEARFIVTIQREIAVIIAIFTKYNLNSTKHLDFLAFERAFLLYKKNNSLEARKEVKPILEGIKSEMNSQRTDFNLPLNRYKITPNWLLGFVEGDGWFSFSPQERFFTFGIIQKGNKLLLEAIQDFLNNLVISNYDPKGTNKDKRFAEECGVLGLDNCESALKIIPNKKGLFSLIVKRAGFIEMVIIPLFDSLTWHTKKYLDYCDWKAIFNLRKMGLHYLPEGKALIECIVKQMNNYRLSTNTNHPKVDRTLLFDNVAKLLNGPSNYEIKDGKIYIKSLNRYFKEIPYKAQAIQLVDVSNQKILSTFNSFNDCAKFLVVSKTTVHNRLNKSTQFLYNGELACLKRVLP